MAKSAILVDFDNIFLGLWAIDRELAFRFGNEPGTLLEYLAERYLTLDQRRWLVARCYLNPSGYVVVGRYRDGSEDRHYFTRFRPFWTRAGFEVIDTPTLAREKNAADIRIVIDALDLLNHPTAYDEFIIASGDSDFTPLLQKLRVYDKKIAVLVPGNAARAYVSVADRVLNADAIGDLLYPEQFSEVEDNLDGDEPTFDPSDLTEAEARFGIFIRSAYKEATEPLNLALLAQRAGDVVPELRDARWGGKGFVSAVDAQRLPNARVDQHFLWDEERHERSDAELPVLIDTLAKTVDFPRIPSAYWPAVFDAVSGYLDGKPFNLSDLTKSIRDSLASSSTPVSRAAINYVVRGAQFGGAVLGETPPPNREVITRAFLMNLVSLARESGVDVDEEDEREIASWLGLA